MRYGTCFLCGKTGWLEEHHVYPGPFRDKSEKYGLKVGLCGESCHRNGRYAAHQCRETSDAASLTAGSDNNGGAGFIIGDAGDNAVSSLKYRVTATHGAGVTAKDNLGADSSPVVAIAAGSKTKDTAAYTPFRNVFYGTSADKPALDSAAIRALGKTGKAYAAGTLTINVPVGAQRVAIACIATAKGVTKVINETAMNADVTSTFTKSTVSVEGANGYAAKDYNVWVFEPAVAYGNAAVLKVTLG